MIPVGVSQGDATTSRAQTLGEHVLRPTIIAALGAILLAFPAAAQVPPFPAGFRTQEIATNGATLHVRIGGKGPAVLLLHGYGETGDMWAPLAAELAPGHLVVVPDLRGIGLSSRPASGYDKKTPNIPIASPSSSSWTRRCPA